VQCTILASLKSEMGHKLALPHCNILSRFTPISRHNPKAARQETLTRKTGRLGGVFQPPNRADILRLTYSKISEIGITAKACVGTDREVHLAIVDYDRIDVLDFPHIPYRNSADSFLLTRSKTSEIGISAEACLGKAIS